VFRQVAAYLINKGAAHAETGMYAVVHGGFEYDSFTKIAAKYA
jgi:hypothetical protein